MFDFAVDQRGSRLTAAVVALAAPGALPAIVHCSAGKDRTGLVIALVIALVLDLAGVPAEVIAEDFALTSSPARAPSRIPRNGPRRALSTASRALRLRYVLG
ncbi:tyrosine-protein phosphatase [Frankia sp. QA3]|uniref:tyrosine-protein phosphatase n=1 Tax=Frankia sp. QA3 TaxID=710111 RepID=UPI000685F462